MVSTRSPPGRSTRKISFSVWNGFRWRCSKSSQKSTASTDAVGRGKGACSTSQSRIVIPWRAAALEELGPGAAALDGVVQPDDVPAARPGERREMARERARRPGAAGPRPGAGAAACPGSVAGGTRGNRPPSRAGGRARRRGLRGRSRRGPAARSRQGAGARGACVGYDSPGHARRQGRGGARPARRPSGIAGSASERSCRRRRPRRGTSGRRSYSPHGRRRRDATARQCTGARLRARTRRSRCARPLRKSAPAGRRRRPPWSAGPTRGRDRPRGVPPRP